MRVAAGIAQAGMNGLEAVDIEQREQRLVEAVAQRVQRLHQRDAVAQPGQRVARQGGVALALASRHGGKFRFLALGDIGRQAQAIGRHILLGDDGGAQFQPAIGPAAAAGAEFQAEGLAGTLAIFLQRVGYRSRGPRDGDAPSNRHATGSFHAPTGPPSGPLPATR